MIQEATLAPARFTVPACHPSLPGHFPGRPIVPGVLLLDAVFQAAAHGAPTLAAPIRLVRAKFAASVGPEEEVSVVFERPSPDRLAFACHCRGIRVLWGEIAGALPRDAA